MKFTTLSELNKKKKHNSTYALQNQLSQMQIIVSMRHRILISEISGVVDKSVELFSANTDSLTINKLFDLLGRAEPENYDSDQIDDIEYCTSKMEHESTENPQIIIITSTMPIVKKFDISLLIQCI